MSGALDELAGLLGVVPHYYDTWGNQRFISEDTKRSILSAMGITDTEGALAERRKRPWNRFLQPVMVVTKGEDVRVPVFFPLDRGAEPGVSIETTVESEDGRKHNKTFGDIAVADSAEIDGWRYVRVDLPVLADEIGYYTVKVSAWTPAGGHSGSMRLVIAPRMCHVPEGRTWGLTLMLYSLRSERNWGIGDLGDLKALMKGMTKTLGGGFVGINPLHAIPNDGAMGISPYSPISRLYRNFIYIDMSDVEEVAESGVLDGPGFRGLNALRRAEFVDYEKVAALKAKALRAAFDIFYEKHYKARSSRGRGFIKYIEDEGKGLFAYATYMALVEHLRRENPRVYGWRDFPEEYRDPEGSAVEQFRKSHGREVLFYKFIQWLMDGQLRKAAKAASGMPVGIYYDLAIGSTEGGSDSWGFTDIFGIGMNVGAPPDAFNINGQDWGYPPLVPEKLMETGYELFIQTIRKNMKYGGALRIDHALGLYRLFWVPHGGPPAEGAYVKYPFNDLVGIIALESARNRTAIIAEDLGTIVEEAREAFQARGMFSYRLFYFERHWDKERVFKKPMEYPEKVFAAITTHDLPTIKGWWAGRDIEVRKSLGIYQDEDVWRCDIEERKRDKALMLEALAAFYEDGTLSDIEAFPEMTPELYCRIYGYLAATPSKLVAVGLDDVLELTEQQNMPGTIDTHPNWVRKLPLTVKEILKDKRIKKVASIFRAARGERKG